MLTFYFHVLHYYLCRAYGVLVWEVATYAESPHDQLNVRELIEHASSGSLSLNRYVAEVYHLLSMIIMFYF